MTAVLRGADLEQRDARRRANLQPVRYHLDQPRRGDHVDVRALEPPGELLPLCGRDDSVRLDVRYVENWTLTFDLMIL